MEYLQLFVTYANIDKWKAPSDFEKFKPKHKLDQWILSELNALILEVTEQMDDYNLTCATRPLSDFMDNLSKLVCKEKPPAFLEV